MKRDTYAAVEFAANLKRNLEASNGSPFRELFAPILFGLLAHSHSWKGEKSNPFDNVETSLSEADQNFVRHPREMINVVCVSDLATWKERKATAVSQVSGGPIDGNANVLTGYVGHGANSQTQKDYFSPLGTLLAKVGEQLSWNHPEMRPLQTYFHRTNIQGAGRGKLREWSINIYSDETKQSLSKHGHRPGTYSEWAVAY